MTQTPYEIRFNLLMIAKDHLLNEYHAKLNVAQETKSNYPEFPTDQKIFELAESFKNFVDKK